MRSVSLYKLVKNVQKLKNKMIKNYRNFGMKNIQVKIKK